MAEDRHDEDFNVYDDVEEHVDLDEHERARADARRKKAIEKREQARHEDTYDEYRYGEDSGEAYGDQA